MDADRSHRRGRISVLAALVAASACLAGAVPAAADSGPTWTPFVGISPLGFFTQGATAAAANAEGDELIAWVLGSMDIYYVRRSAGGEFSDPVHLDAWGDDPQPSLNAHGDALVMWNSGLKGATGTLIPAGGDPESFAVSTGSEDSTAMYSLGGIADDGTVTVFWTDVGQIWYSRRAPGGSFAKPKSVPNPGTWANGLDARVAADGSAVLTWSSGATEYASTASAHSGFTTVALTSADDPSALDYDPLWNEAGGGVVATNAEGDSVVAWIQPRNHSRENDVLAATRLAGHSFTSQR